MSGPLLLGIDEGTTAVKAALFESDLTLVAEARRPVPVSHPRPGWVEQDPELILEAVVESVAEVLEAARGREVTAAGLDHQGESVLAWDADSGRALSPVIVWQDKRHERLLEGIDPAVQVLTGLPRDPYFSAGKLAWLLEEQPALRLGAAAGKVRLGTVDAFLADRLGGCFQTDLSTASRTQLLALGGLDWDERLLGFFGLERSMLPRLGPSFGELGTISHERWGEPLALRAQLVDQQAALAGSGAVAAGTGEGDLRHGCLHSRPHPGGACRRRACCRRSPGPGRVSRRARLRTGRRRIRRGALLEWLAGGLGLAADPPALAAMAATVPDSGGVMVLPALSGLGSPWWVPGARGVVAGLHAGVEPAHLARAALEGIAHRVADVLEAMAAAVEITGLRVDGGLTNDETLLETPGRPGGRGAGRRARRCDGARRGDAGRRRGGALRDGRAGGHADPAGAQDRASPRRAGAALRA